MSKAQTAKFRESIKKELIELLAKGYGIAESCKKVGISRPSYYNWRKADARFDHQVQQILDDPVHAQRIVKGQAKADAEVLDTWQEKFLATFRKTGDKVGAAVASGKRATEIEAALDPKSDSYDDIFHLSYLEEEQKRIWRIEDNLFEKAIHDGPSARFILSNLLKEKYGKVEGSVTVNTQQWFTQKGSDEAKDFLAGVLGNDPVGDQRERRSDPVLAQHAEEGDTTDWN